MKIFKLLAIFFLFGSTVKIVGYHLFQSLYLLVYWSYLVFELVMIQGWLIVTNQYVFTSKYTKRISQE
jgi:hypothetical protein